MYYWQHSVSKLFFHFSEGSVLRPDWAITYRQEVKDSISVLPPLCRISLTGPHIPLRHFPLHLGLARGVQQAEQEGRAPQGLHLGHHRRVDGVDEAGEDDGAVARGRHARHDQTPVVAAGAVVAAGLAVGAALDLARAERGVAERGQLVVDGFFGARFGLGPSLLVGRVEVGGETECPLQLGAEGVVRFVEAGAQDHVVGLDLGAVVEMDLVVDEGLDARSVDRAVPGVEDLPEVGYTRGSETGICPEDSV